jgi:hypothetical protein
MIRVNAKQEKKKAPKEAKRVEEVEKVSRKRKSSNYLKDARQRQEKVSEERKAESAAKRLASKVRRQQAKELAH